MDMTTEPPLPKIVTYIGFDSKTEKFSVEKKVIWDSPRDCPIIALPVIHNESRHQSK